MSRRAIVNYKYCVVPNCQSSTVATPHKAFINIPRDEEIREKWSKIIKREPLPSTSMHHICEDHFDLENDADNYMRWKVMEGTCEIRLRSGVAPHKNLDLNPPAGKKIKQLLKTKPQSNLNPKAKRLKRNEILEQKESQDDLQLCSTTTPTVKKSGAVLFVKVNKRKCFELNKTQNIDSTIEIKEESDSDEQCYDHIKIVNIKSITDRVETEANEMNTQVDKQEFSASKETKINPKSATAAFSLSKPQRLNSETISMNAAPASIENILKDSVELDSHERIKFTDDNFKLFMVEGTMKTLENDPELYLGTPKNTHFWLKMLSDKINVPLSHIYIALRKIRLDEHCAILGTQFGRSSNNTDKIIKNTIPKISKVLKEFIVWPSKNKIAQNLPKAFIRNYSNVQSIIQCFEIPIPKPFNNSSHDTLTWSQEKECNTIKYMISCTPDGLVNFVSCGFGGSASDTSILLNSGYIKNLSPGMDVMTDRGFKNASFYLNQQKCRLLRPVDAILLVDTNNISSLRAYIERIVGRLRDFSMITPRSCINSSYLSLYDDIVIIVCALINMQVV